jgi:hypothetical protein
MASLLFVRPFSRSSVGSRNLVAIASFSSKMYPESRIICTVGKPRDQRL